MGYPGVKCFFNKNGLELVPANGRVNDLSFILDNRLIVLVERQSTRNDLMPYRMLLYISKTFSLLYEQALQYRRSIDNTRLNRPKFFISTPYSNCNPARWLAVY